MEGNPVYTSVMTLSKIKKKNTKDLMDNQTSNSDISHIHYYDSANHKHLHVHVCQESPPTCTTNSVEKKKLRQML